MINVTSRLFVKKSNPSDGFAQARNQLGIPGGAKSFLRGAQFFYLCPIVFNFVQHIFPGGQTFFYGDLRPLIPPIYGPAEGTIECL